MSSPSEGEVNDSLPQDVGGSSGPSDESAPGAPPASMAQDDESGGPSAGGKEAPDFSNPAGDDLANHGSMTRHGVVPAQAPHNTMEEGDDAPPGQEDEHHPAIGANDKVLSVKVTNPDTLDNTEMDKQNMDDTNYLKSSETTTDSVPEASQLNEPASGFGTATADNDENVGYGSAPGVGVDAITIKDDAGANGESDPDPVTKTLADVLVAEVPTAKVVSRVPRAYPGGGGGGGGCAQCKRAMTFVVSAVVHLSQQGNRDDQAIAELCAQASFVDRTSCLKVFLTYGIKPLAAHLNSLPVERHCVTFGMCAIPLPPGTRALQTVLSTIVAGYIKFPETAYNAFWKN
jgi:hypothetical protein